MLYIIDSNSNKTPYQVFRVIKMLEKYGVEYKLLSTYKRCGDWADLYVTSIDPKIVKGIMEAHNYDLKKLAKAPSSKTVSIIAKRHPQAVKEYRSVKFIDKRLSEIVDWFSKHPYILKAGIIYDDRTGVCLPSLRNDDFRTFLPKSKKKSIRQAALCLAFEELGIADEFDANNRSPRLGKGIYAKGESKWE